jgi:hypothetical protein
MPFGVNGLARFEADALAVPNVTDVLILEGINDLGGGATADEVIGGLAKLVARAKQRRLRVILGTLTPFGGTIGSDEYGSDATNTQRKKVNQWIHTGSGADAVVDFDAATRDPQNPSRLRPEYDSSDHLHPSTAGYRAMAAAIDPQVFRGTPCQAQRSAGARRCLARAQIGSRNIGGVRLNRTRHQLLRLPVEPRRRTGRVYRYCVTDSRAQVTAVFSSRGRRGRVRLVVTTAGRERSFPRRRRVAPDLYRASARSRRIIATRRGKVRFIGVADAGLLRSGVALRHYLRIARR